MMRREGTAGGGRVRMWGEKEEGGCGSGCSGGEEFAGDGGKEGMREGGDEDVCGREWVKEIGSAEVV